MLVFTPVLVDVACMFQFCIPFLLLTSVLEECPSFCHGIGSVIASDGHRIKVCLFSFL
jgi:hypothetical protein